MTPNTNSRYEPFVLFYTQNQNSQPSAYGMPYSYATSSTQVPAPVEKTANAAYQQLYVGNASKPSQQQNLYPSLDDVKTPNYQQYTYHYPKGNTPPPLYVPPAKNTPSKDHLKPSLGEKAFNLLSNLSGRVYSLALAVGDLAIGSGFLCSAMILGTMGVVGYALTANLLVVTPPLGILMGMSTAALFYTDLKVTIYAFDWFAAAGSNLVDALSF
jgi:hypothetical protein